MFQNTYTMMKDAGYVPIGLDHFAKKGDELEVALNNRNLHRNFQGYCALETTGQVYAFGVSGISQLDCGYGQNTHSLRNYIKSVNHGKFPTEKGYMLSSAEKIVRHVINQLMCNQYVSWEFVSRKFNCSAEDVKNIIGYNKSVLDVFQKEKLITFDDHEIQVTETGRFFIRNIASAFDPGLTHSGKEFSKAF